MPFPRRLLTEGEQIVVELRPHWSLLGWSLPAALVVVAGSLAMVALWPSAPLGALYPVAALLASALAWLGARALRWRTTELVVTTARLVLRSGVLARRGLEMRLDRINEISYTQSILDRVLRSGTVTVETGGEAGVAVLTHVRRPSAVVSVVQEQLNALRRRPGPLVRPGEPHDTPPAGTRSSSPPAQASVAQRLIELDELRRRGILSEEEFAAKRAALVEQL